MKCGTVKDHGQSYKLRFNRYFLDGYGAKFWGFVGTNSEPLFVEFRNFVQCRRPTFVTYLTC